MVSIQRDTKTPWIARHVFAAISSSCLARTMIGVRQLATSRLRGRGQGTHVLHWHWEAVPPSFGASISSQAERADQKKVPPCLFFTGGSHYPKVFEVFSHHDVHLSDNAPLHPATSLIRFTGFREAWTTGRQALKAKFESCPRFRSTVNASNCTS